MADLFQSEYDVGSQRRGVQDGETLWALLAEDGTIAIVPDPDEGNIDAARKELTKLNEAGEDEDPEKEAERQKKIAAATRTVSFAPAPTPLPAEEDEDEDEDADEEPEPKAKAKAEPKVTGK